MIILFRSQELQRQCNNQADLVRRFGERVARVLRKRLDELFNANVLDDLRSLRHLRLEELGLARLSIEIGGPYRLLFAPAHDPVPELPAGGLDWKKVNTVLILGVEGQDA